MKQFNVDVLPIIGMSPGNSYFNQQVISQLIKKVIQKYGCAVIFIPDIPSISTYVAMGYEPGKARSSKSIPKGNNLKNKVRRAIREQNIQENLIYIIDWFEDVSFLPQYRESYSRILNLFYTNELFKITMLEETKKVLMASEKNIEDIEMSSLIGVDYILSEFAFLEMSSDLFICEEIVYIYHKDWSPYQNYINGTFDGIIREHMSFEKITFK